MGSQLYSVLSCLVNHFFLVTDADRDSGVDEGKVSDTTLFYRRATGAATPPTL